MPKATRNAPAQAELRQSFGLHRVHIPAPSASGRNVGLANPGAGTSGRVNRR
jgi:hypothetical protein